MASITMRQFALLFFRVPVALCLLCVAGCAGLQSGYYGGDPVWTPSANSTSPLEPIPLSLDDFTVPNEYGSVKETWDSGKPGPIILHVQDANAVYVAQKHSAAILDYLIRQHGLYLVLVEGGSRNDSLSYMRESVPIERRRQVAEEFLRAGRISGENYLDLVTDHDFLVYGVEAPELYDQNMDAVSTSQKLQPEALAVLLEFQRAIDALKERLYPPEVRDLEAREEAVETKRFSLADHYKALAEEAKQRGMPVTGQEYPNLWNFLNASHIEKDLDFKEMETSLRDVDSEVAETGNISLSQRYLDYKTGHISTASFYKDLNTNVRPERLSRYPGLTQYMEYLRGFAAINHGALFVEAESLSDRVKASYFRTKEERAVALLAKNLHVLRDLLNLSLTPESYGHYVQHRPAFKPEEWAGQLAMLGSKQNPSLVFELAPAPLARAIPTFANFYEIARQRDQAMIENTMKRIEESNVPFAVLIAGGFHTPEFTRLLKERQVSYAVIAPQIGVVGRADKEKYYKALAQTYVPMSRERRKTMQGQAQTASSE